VVPLTASGKAGPLAQVAGAFGVAKNEYATNANTPIRITTTTTIRIREIRNRDFFSSGHRDELKRCERRAARDISSV
jgi:hypothetical protein